MQISPSQWGDPDHPPLVFPIPLPSTTFLPHSIDYFLTYYIFYLFTILLSVSLWSKVSSMRAGVFVRVSGILQTHETAPEHSIIIFWMNRLQYLPAFAGTDVYLSMFLTRVWAPEGHSLCCSCSCFQSPEQCELCNRPFVTGIKEGISLL